MSDVNPQLVEKYQVMLQKDPRSRVFAPLVDAYRKMGMLEEALEEALKGVRIHPDFAGGRIALARVLIEREQFEPASEHLKRALELSPENHLGFSLLAEVLIRLRQPKEALQTYKMVLFLNPEDERALKAVKKLESLTADEFNDETFQMMPIRTFSERENHLETLSPEATEEEKEAHVQAMEEREKRRWSDIERTLSLVDAFIVRNEFERAKEVLEESEKYHSEDPEFIKRRKILNQISSEPIMNDTEPLEADQGVPLPPDSGELVRPSEKYTHLPTHLQRRAKYLELLLARISDRAESYSF